MFAQYNITTDKTGPVTFSANSKRFVRYQ